MKYYDVGSAAKRDTKARRAARTPDRKIEFAAVISPIDLTATERTDQPFTVVASTPTVDVCDKFGGRGTHDGAALILPASAKQIDWSRANFRGDR